MAKLFSFPNPVNETSARIVAGGAVLKGKIYNPVAWGPNGEGPEGWVSKLPILGFEWFVYTLRSRVDYLLSVPAQKVRAMELSNFSSFLFLLTRDLCKISYQYAHSLFFKSEVGDHIFLAFVLYLFCGLAMSIFAHQILIQGSGFAHQGPIAHPSTIF